MTDQNEMPDYAAALEVCDQIARHRGGDGDGAVRELPGAIQRLRGGSDDAVVVARDDGSTRGAEDAEEKPLLHLNS